MPKPQTHQHADLAAGQWRTLSFFEQMANLGTEVERALRWKQKNRPAIARDAFIRANELLDLTLQCQRTKVSRMKELGRVKECFFDDFAFANQYGSSPKVWASYFRPFIYAVRKEI